MLPDQHVGADPDSDCGAAGRADIITAERAGSHISTRREHRPDQYTAIGIADIDAELGNGAGVVLGVARPGCEGAMQRL
jgi:hypothetical protein